MSLLVSDSPKIFFEVFLQDPQSPNLPLGVTSHQTVFLDIESDAIDFAVHAVGHPFVNARIYVCRMVYDIDWMNSKIDRRLVRVYALHNSGVYLDALYPFNLSTIFDSPSDSAKELN